MTFWGTYEEARAKMVAHFGDKWAFQYDESGWTIDGKTQAEIYGYTEIK
jgi:hypothetical protein